MSPARIRRLRAALAALLLTVTGVAMATHAIAGSRSPGPTPYQRALSAQVDTATGTPRSGRDPADQKQTALAAIAGRPNGGAGARPAVEAEKTGARKGGGGHAGTHHAVSPSAVLPHPSTSRHLASGCLIGYGAPGAQCLPVRAPGNKPVTCAYVVTLFPEGIAVTGKDRLRLDTDKDKIACDAGDRRR